MSIEIKKEIQLEIAHVLFIDIVGYSKLSINQQRAVVDELTEVVRSSDQYQKADAAGRLIKIPTGDGMALVFYTSPEAPAQCAVEITRALKEHPRLQLRMGVHSGPVSGVIDVNGHANLAGAGLNMAQRVMDCGDAGHILVSKRVADDLGEYEHWRPLLHDLGECEVKHGVRVAIVNLHADEVGYETGSEAFGKGHLYVDGALATHVDEDFQNGVKFLMMAIDRFRNEKSHTADGNISDPIRAYEYLRLSSLAMHLLEGARVLTREGKGDRPNDSAS
jgi:class 3 adenylate cyclase